MGRQLRHSACTPPAPPSQSVSLQPDGSARIALGTSRGDVLLWDVGRDSRAALARAADSLAAAALALRDAAEHPPKQTPLPPPPAHPSRSAVAAAAPAVADAEEPPERLSAPFEWAADDPSVPAVAPCRTLEASPTLVIGARAVAFAPGGRSLLVALETGIVQRWSCVSIGGAAAAARPLRLAARPVQLPHPPSARTPALLRELQVRGEEGWRRLTLYSL